MACNSAFDGVRSLRRSTLFPASMGRELSFENATRAPTVCSQREGHTDGRTIASCRRARRSPRAMSTSRNCRRENRETSPASRAYQPPDRRWRPQAQSVRGRRRGVEHNLRERARAAKREGRPQRPSDRDCDAARQGASKLRTVCRQRRKGGSLPGAADNCYPYRDGCSVS
jgi:hypothetical protein